MAASITRGKTFTVNEEVTNTKLHQLVDSATISSIDETNFDLTAANAVEISASTPASNNQKVWYDSGNSVLKVRDSGNTFQEIGFAAGTKMLFQQTAAPTGWTKDVTHNDKALRVVTGTVSTGGSVAFSTALGTPSVTVAGHALTVAEMPAHTHSQTTSVYDQQDATGGGTANNAGDSTSGTTGSAGSGNTHTHSGSTATINCQYIDVIVATKD